MTHTSKLFSPWTWRSGIWMAFSSHPLIINVHLTLLCKWMSMSRVNQGKAGTVSLHPAWWITMVLSTEVILRFFFKVFRLFYFSYLRHKPSWLFHEGQLIYEQKNMTTRTWKFSVKIQIQGFLTKKALYSLPFQTLGPRCYHTEVIYFL